MIIGLTTLIIVLMGCEGGKTSTVERKTSGVTTTSKREENVSTTTITTENRIVKCKTYKILVDTIYETEVFEFESNAPGAIKAVVGGIHGDEVAGWQAATLLIDLLDNLNGKLLLIPKASILACTLVQRYPGVRVNPHTYEGITYADLNRTFPGTNCGTPTEQIAYEIFNCVKDFNPKLIIDLHESLHSRTYVDKNGTSKYLGNEIIFGNSYSSVPAYDICDTYNESNKLEGEENFLPDNYSPDGSFNNTFGAEFKKSYVYTIETNRELDVERRIEQQLSMLKIMFDYVD